MPFRILAVLTCLALAPIAKFGHTAAKPNVLLIIADDQTYRDVGCYGNDELQTPNIDRLASQGMRFTRAFTATAMCAPTRQQLYTGLYPVRNGAYPNHSWVYPETRTMVHHLKALGYRVGLAGKKHFGPAEAFPFEPIAKGKLDEFISRDSSQPYCLIYASNSPHQPWTEGDASQYDPDEISLPPYLVDTPETRKAMTRYYAEITDFDREVGSCMRAVQASNSAENTILIYTSEQGAQMPRGKWTCYEIGLRVALVVRWPMRIKAGSVTDAMVQYVDILPTLIDAAGGDWQAIDTARPGANGGGNGFDGRSFLGVLDGRTDTHATAVFGVHTTNGIINGSPSYPIRSVRTETHRLIWNLQHDAEFQNILNTDADRGGYWSSWVRQAKIDPSAKRFVDGYRKRPEFELYDLRADPWELNNLASEPGQRDLKESMLRQIKDWMDQQGDRGIPTELAAKQRQGKQKNRVRAPNRS